MGDHPSHKEALRPHNVYSHPNAPLPKSEADRPATQSIPGPGRAECQWEDDVLDVLVLLGDIMRFRGDVPEAVRGRSADFSKLLWKAEGSSFQVAVEALIPDDIRARMAEDKQVFRNVRYEIEIGLDRESNEIGLNHETLWLMA